MTQDYGKMSTIEYEDSDGTTWTTLTGEELIEWIKKEGYELSLDDLENVTGGNDLENSDCQTMYDRAKGILDILRQKVLTDESLKTKGDPAYLILDDLPPELKAYLESLRQDI